MTHSKVPIDIGWNYFAINVAIKEHAELKEKTDALIEMTGKNKNRLLIEMVNATMDQELTKLNGRINNEQGDHNTITS